MNPFVETREQAERAVAATRYPPEGIRGVSVSTAGNMFDGVRILRAIQQEHHHSVPQLESRLGVDGAML
ncbi:aldolase/citrate lyase family protein [Shigella flexneri]